MKSELCKLSQIPNVGTKTIAFFGRADRANNAVQPPTRNECDALFCVWGE
jgi:hypothetical protein